MCKILHSSFVPTMSSEEQHSMLETVLRNDPTLNQLDPKAIEEIVGAAKIETYKVPTLLNSAYTAVDTMRLVVKGRSLLLMGKLYISEHNRIWLF